MNESHRSLPSVAFKIKWQRLQGHDTVEIWSVPNYVNGSLMLHFLLDSPVHRGFLSQSRYVLKPVSQKVIIKQEKEKKKSNKDTIKSAGVVASSPTPLFETLLLKYC